MILFLVAFFMSQGLENNHYCRNPDRDDRPWCWTSKQGAFGYCSIPKCTVDQSESVERQSRARGELEWIQLQLM